MGKQANALILHRRLCSSSRGGARNCVEDDIQRLRHLLKSLVTSPLQMPVDLTAILISSTFMGAGLALAKFFPESSLLAAFFLGGLAIVNIGLSLAG